jgi:nitrate/nitrite transporter NarK
MFLIEGLPAIVLGGVVLFFLTDRPQAADWLPDAHRTWLITTLEREHAAISSDTELRASSLLGNLNIWLLAVVYFGLNVCSYGISLWLPSVIRSLSGMSNFQIGLLTSIPYVAAALAMVAIGHHSDRTGERRWHTSLCALTAAVALVAAAFATRAGSVAPMITVITVAVMAQFSMMGPFWAMPTAFLRGTAAAAGIAMINSLGNLGGFFGPYVIGLAKSSTGGFRNGLLVVAFAMAVASGFALLVRLKKPENA